MYQIYTQTRPGHPRRAIGACALLLVATLGLAAWVSDSKVRGTPVNLDSEPRVYPAGRLSVRLPADWDRDESRLSQIPGVVAVARRRAGGPGAALPAGVAIVFRGYPRLHGIPSVDAAENIRQMLGATAPMIEVRSEPARMGPLPAWTLEFAPDAASRAPLHHLGCAALAPDGQVAGVLITVPHPPTREDRRLLENMSDSLALTDLAVADTPAELMREAGISFDPPPDSRFFRSARQPFPLPRILMAGGKGQACWYLEAARVPLVATTTPADLVADHARILLEQVEPPDPLEAVTLGQRPVARTRLTLPGNPTPSVRLWAAGIDPQTALMLLGRFEPAGEDALSQAAEVVLSGSIAPYAALLDIDQARTTARRWLDEIAAEGLAGQWSGLATETTRIAAPALVMRHEVRSYRATTASDGYRWWQIDVASFPPGSQGAAVPQMQEEWSIRDDAACHAQRYRERSRRQVALQYSELRLPGQNEVVCELTRPDAEPHRWKVPIDNTYACEPVLLAVGAKVARDPQARPALFSATECFLSRPAQWTMIPLGRQTLPGTDRERAADAVCVLRDYHPLPILLYYDERGNLLATSFDDVFWRQRAEAPDDAEVAP